MISKSEYQTLISLKNSKELFICPRRMHPRIHAKFVDRIIGYRTSFTEQNLLKNYQGYLKNDESNRKSFYAGTQAWIGLHPEVLQTTYFDFIEMLDLVDRGAPQHIVDLGMAYGRLGLLMKYFRPDSTFCGYEIVKERIKEARRVYEKYGIDPEIIIEKNLLDYDFILPEADVYFIYDFSDVLDLRLMMQHFLKLIEIKSFALIARGEGINSLIQSRYPQFMSKSAPYKRDDWVIYKNY